MRIGPAASSSGPGARPIRGGRPLPLDRQLSLHAVVRSLRDVIAKALECSLTGNTQRLADTVPRPPMWALRIAELVDEAMLTTIERRAELVEGPEASSRQLPLEARLELPADLER